MNKDLCYVLKNKLIGLPFVEILGGMVQTVTTIKALTDEPEGPTKTLKFPVTYDVIANGKECIGAEYAMIPNSNRKSLIYFEDFGVNFINRQHELSFFSSNVRLICWMNRALLVGDWYEEISGRAMAVIIDRLTGKNPESIHIFSRLTIEIAKIPPQDTAIFGRYSYDENVRQHLMPPFEFFALDLTCRYAVSGARCIEPIPWNQATCY